MQSAFDIIIVGSGLAGSSLVCALAPLKLNIALVEAKPALLTTTIDTDGRSLTLADSSRKIFTGMGLWPALQDAVTPIRSIHVSEQGRFGSACLEAGNLNLDAIGYVTPMQQLLNLLEHQAAQHAHIFQPAQVQALVYDQALWQVQLKLGEQEQTITAPLVVAADGAHSTIRRWQNISVTTHDYQQTAMVSQVSVSQPQAFTAYERFTDSGPWALLPRGGKYYGAVCTVPHDQASAWLAFNDEEFLSKLQQGFGWRLGRFMSVGKRHAYPLTLIHADQQVQPGLVLLGNAAHTLHPVAGQGFNLALRDIAHLADALANAVQQRQALCDWPILASYAQQRAAEQRHLLRFTDGLTRMFNSKRWPTRLGRRLGLLLLDQSPLLQQKLTQTLLGQNGRLPRLACGLALLDSLHTTKVNNSAVKGISG